MLQPPRRAETLREDRAKTAAVALYIRDHRADIDNDITGIGDMDKNTRWNELRRWGRVHFNQATPTVQESYIAKVRQGVRSSPCKRLRIRSKQPHQMSLPVALPVPATIAPVTPPRKQTLVPLANNMPGHASNAADITVLAAEAARYLSGTCDVQRAMARHLSWFWKRFGVATGAEVLASAVRILPYAKGLRAKASPDIVAAALLALATKFTFDMSPEDVRAVWCHVGGQANLHEIRAVELRVVEVWALNGLDGEYARDRLAMLMLPQ